MPGRNAEIVTRLYEEMLGPGRMKNPANAELVPQFFDPEVELRQTNGILGSAGTFHGHQGIVEGGQELLRAFSDVGFTVERLVERGPHVVAVVVVRGQGRSSGVWVEVTIGHLWTLRDGMVVRWVVYYDPAEALDAVADQ
jgi:uncharacterized protein